MGQYRPMFNVSIEHTYFGNGRLAGVEMIPTPQSTKLMTNANLVIRKRDDGLTVFFDNDYLDTLKLYASDDEDPLQMDFECEVDQGNFKNFTASSAFGDNKTLFFDSRSTDSTLIGKKYLHDHDFVSADDLAENFVGPHALTSTHSSVLNFSDKRALLFDEQQTQRNPHGKIALNPEDAQSRLELTRDIASATNSAISRPPSLGLISIQVTAQELDQLTRSAPDVYNDYCIKFKARETHWKYFLIGDANREGAFVKDVNGEIEFDDLGEEELANGRKARVFLSRQAIPLADRSKPKFQLQVPKNNRIKVLVKRLAVASAKRLNKIILEDKELFISEIYINF